MANKPISNGADAVSIRKWTEEHARDAERDEAIERDEILAAVSDVLGPERTKNIVTDVFDSWMRAISASRGVR